MPLAINISERIIDKKKPQEHWYITEEKAEVYKKLLPNEVKIIDDEPKGDTTPIEEHAPVVEQTSTVELTPVVEQTPNIGTLGLDTPAGEVGGDSENDEMFG